MAGGSAEKRKAEEADAAPEEGTRRSKRRRWDSADDSNAAKDDAGAAAETDASKAATDEPAAKKPALSLAEKLAKAKAAAAKAKELAEKLKGAKAAAGPAGPAPKAKGPSAAVQKALELAGKIRSGATAAASTAAAAKGPVSLRLNDKGQEVDEHGVLVTANEVAVSTFAVNAKSAKLEAFANAEKQAAEDVAGTGAEDWQDPRMGKGGRRRDRRSTFQFVKEGKFQRQADMVRLQAKFGETEARKIAAREARERRAVAERERLEATADPNLIPLGARAGIKGGMAGAASSRAAFVLDEIPEAEWWDVHILKNGTYDDISDGKWEIKPEKINLYVEHPVPMQPPMEAPPPPPQPLKLTKREQKKLRTQRRQQREQEKQEMIRQGLLEPPKPKVKISNLMRVLTDEATADPTAIEKEVRQQMEERASAHEDRNLARQLTPAERRERKIRKLFDDPTGSVETQVHVYRVESLANPKNQFRVDINAQENRLSGVCLITESFCIVIVEGGVKSVRRYEKLMMRRIDWNAQVDGENGAGEPEYDDDTPLGEETVNECTCVWKGTTPKPSFKKFRFETLRTEAAARKYLQEMGLAHLFDAAAACVAVSADFDEDM